MMLLGQVQARLTGHNPSGEAEDPRQASLLQLGAINDRLRQFTWAGLANPPSGRGGVSPLQGKGKARKKAFAWP